jgi:hypothetical protein
VLGDQFRGQRKIEIAEGEGAGGAGRHGSGLDRPLRMKNGVIFSCRLHSSKLKGPEPVCRQACA